MTPHDDAIDPPADSTGKLTTRDTPSSSSVPSARTVTRLSAHLDADGDFAYRGDPEGMLCLFADVDPLLTALAGKETEIADMKHTVTLAAQHWRECDAQITLLTARAEAAEAKVIDTEAKCGQEIINLRTQLQAAEATVAHLRERMDAYAQWLWQHNEGADRIVAERLNEISKEAVRPPSAPPQEPT